MYLISEIFYFTIFLLSVKLCCIFLYFLFLIFLFNLNKLLTYITENAANKSANMLKSLDDRESFKRELSGREKKTFNGVSCYVKVVSPPYNNNLGSIFPLLFIDANLSLYDETQVKEADCFFDVVIEYKNSSDMSYSRDKVKIYDSLTGRYSKREDIYDCVNVYLMLKGENLNLFPEKQDKDKKKGKCCC